MNVEERNEKIIEVVNVAIDKTRRQACEILRGVRKIAINDVINQALFILNTHEVEDIPIILRSARRRISESAPGMGYYLEEAAEKVAKLLKE